MADLTGHSMKSTVMGPEESYSTLSTQNAYRAPSRTTNVTPKFRYRESHRRWPKKINVLSNFTKERSKRWRRWDIRYLNRAIRLLRIDC